MSNQNDLIEKFLIGWKVFRFILDPRFFYSWCFVLTENKVPLEMNQIKKNELIWSKIDLNWNINVASTSIQIDSK